MDQLHGVYTGVVVDTNDPQGRGRVRLQIPQVAGLAVTAWALPAGHGVAEVGDQVSVAHDGSDRSYPTFWPVRPVPVYVPPEYEHPQLGWTDVTGIDPKYTAHPEWGWLQPQYAVGADGAVHVQGLIFSTGTLADGDDLFTLPWPPANGLIYPVIGSSTSAVKVRITAVGGAALFEVHDTPSPTANWISFGHLIYVPA